MPYQTVDELPDDIKEKYADNQQRAFLAAFNATFEACESDDTQECESDAFSAGHAAAQNAEKTIASEDVAAVDLNALVEKTGVLYKLKSMVSSRQFHGGGFKVIDDDRWIAWYSNAFGPDKDDEFISEKAIEDDVEIMVLKGVYPELWFFHTKGAKHGQADAVGKIGRFAVATGTFDNTEVANVFKRFYQEHDGEIAMSFGFDFDPISKSNGVYHKIRTFEISTVWPPRYAANPYTAFDVFNPKGKSMNNVTALEKVFADNTELLQQIVDDTEAGSKALEETTAYKALLDKFKEAATPTPELETESEDTTKMGEGVSREEVMEMLEVFMTEMKGMFEKMAMPPTEEKPPDDDEMEKANYDDMLRTTLQQLTIDTSPNQAIKVHEMSLDDAAALIMSGGVESYEKATGKKVHRG